jgi:hypothetical protein
MAIATAVSPPYSIILIVDPSDGEIPSSLNGGLVAATPSCIAVGTRAEDDGLTRISLGSAAELDHGDQLVFEGKIDTPTQKVCVRSVLGVRWLELAVSERQTAVRVWVNDPREPDQIVIGILTA